MKRKIQYIGVTHIDTSNEASKIRPLCGERRQGDGFLYHAEGWKIHGAVTCPQCLEIGEFYSQGFSIKDARRVANEKRLPVVV